MFFCHWPPCGPFRTVALFMAMDGLSGREGVLRGMILVLIGRSGSGKSAVAAGLAARWGYSGAKSCTTIVHVEADMKTSAVRAILREPDMDPGKMKRISDRAIMDSGIYAHPQCDAVVANDGSRPVWEVAEEVARLHAAFAEGRLEQAAREATP